MCPAKTPSCFKGCETPKHGDLVSGAIVRGTDDEAIAYIRNLCSQGPFLVDCTGKTALHTAASSNKLKVVQWLLSHGADINSQDKESGYSALHRAIYYGNINIAVFLRQKKANLTILDKEGLSPLDLIACEKPIIRKCTNITNLQLYMWGTNTNYNLGQSTLHSKEIPEYVELIHRGGDYIKNISLNKFHTIFLTNHGKALACGFGIGGRLGLGEEASVIIPEEICGLKSSVKMVAAGVDHSLFLTELNQIFSCGKNDYHQLGISPPPKSISRPQFLSNFIKSQKEQIFKGVGAAKYHSIVWSDTSLYTFGLNAGQLGHIKNSMEKTIINPRQVAGLVINDCTNIQTVGVSDGAVIVHTSDGRIQVLHQYQVRCIASKLKGVVKVDCIGGSLDHEVVGGKLTEKGGLDLRIAALDNLGYLYIWTEDTHKLAQCLFTPKRRLVLQDFCLNQFGFGLITKELEAFTGVLLAPEKLTRIYKSHFNSMNVDSVFQIMKVKRISALHRTISLMCDPKGNNFAALQYKPKQYLKFLPGIDPSTFSNDFEELLRKSSEIDLICDFIFIIDNERFPVHSFLLSEKCSYLAKLIPKVRSNKKSMSEFDIKNAVRLDVDVNLFKQILRYIYTGTCQLFVPGPCAITVTKKIERITENEDPNKSKIDTTPKRNKNNKRKKSGKMDLSSSTSAEDDLNPVLSLQKIAKFWKMWDLEEKLNYFNLTNSFLTLKGAWKGPLPPQAKVFSRNSFPNLYDVTFICQDGVSLRGHKCVLVARSIYFEAMFMSGWMETNQSGGIKMQVQSTVLQVILDYLYSDGPGDLIQLSQDIDFICDVLAAAHQFLIIRLQQICERSLAKMINFKNVFEFLDFSECFDAKGLKSSVYEFICFNFSTFFENGSLASLDHKSLEELSDFYKYVVWDKPLPPLLANTFEELNPMYEAQNPGMACRFIDAPLPEPSLRDLKISLDGDPSVATESEETWLKQSLKINKSHSKPTPSSTRKRRPSRNSESSAARGNRSRKSSTSSQISFTSQDSEEIEPFSFDDLEERSLKDDTKGSTVERIDCDSWTLVGKSPRGEKINLEQETLVLKDDTLVLKDDLEYTDKKISATPPVLPPDLEAFPSLAETVAASETPRAPSGSKTSSRMPKFQLKTKKYSATEAIIKQTSSPSTPPWRSTPTSDATSLVDIMKAEAAVEVLKSPKVSSVKSGSASPAQHEKKSWNVGTDACSSSALSSIMKDELVQLQKINRAKTKTLELIQLEDRAMSELLSFYGGPFNPEERVLVSRVSADDDAPGQWMP